MSYCLMNQGHEHAQWEMKQGYVPESLGYAYLKQNFIRDAQFSKIVDEIITTEKTSKLQSYLTYRQIDVALLP